MTWVLIIYMNTFTPRPSLDHVYFHTQNACEVVAEDLRQLKHYLIKCYPTTARQP